MTIKYTSRFTDGKGAIFTVSAVKETPVGVTVFYANESTKQEYSCLLEAFGQRFTELVQ